jgi:dGTPase
VIANTFETVKAYENNSKWNNMISRMSSLYKRQNDIRSEFGRDYTRILHSTAYRRLKHKTQVFFAPQNDHICTRIEHVSHVESVSFTIANYLGLNTELTKAISVGHDLGHAPFGHLGETIIQDILREEGLPAFWHEKNGLHYVDEIELLEDNSGYKKNLDLTYAVRDGIISHCGEVDQNGLKPRDEFIDLKNYQSANQYQPYTWEGCVVKVADKISYLGREI